MRDRHKEDRTMRERYDELELEIIRFSSVDIITTSREYDDDLDGEYVEE